MILLECSRQHYSASGALLRLTLYPSMDATVIVRLLLFVCVKGFACRFACVGLVVWGSKLEWGETGSYCMCGNEISACQ